MRFKIYKHTNIVTRKAYVGYTSSTIENRFAGHVRSSRYGSPQAFHCAIRKYGTECWKSEILIECGSLRKAWKLEQEMIEIHKTFGRPGYNMTKGGEGGSRRTMTKVQKQKSREWHLKFRHTKTSKKMMKEKFTALRGRSVNQYSKEGKYIQTFPSCVQAAEFLGNKNLSGSIQQMCTGTFKRWKQVLIKGFQWRTDTKDNHVNIEKAPDLQTGRINKLIQKNIASSKSVEQYDLQNNLLRTFSSIAEASRQTNVYHTGIGRCCRNNLNTAGGFIWKYVD